MKRVALQILFALSLPAFAQNVLPVSINTFGADGTGITDSTSAIQNAVNTGAPVTAACGNYKISNSIIFSTKSQSFGGPAARNCVVFKIPTSFNLSARGIFVANTGEEGPHWRDFTMDFDQSGVAKSGTRANLIAYPAAILAQNTPRFTIENVRINNAINCLDMRGNSGGAFIDTFETSCYGIGIQIDGSLDGIRIYKWHNWPFGLVTWPSIEGSMTDNQVSIYNDGHTLGLSSGRVDGLICDACVWINAGTQTNFFTGTGGGHGWPAGPSTAFLSSCDWDTYGGFSMTSGDIQITNSMFTEGPLRSSYLIHQTGGQLAVSNSIFSAIAQMTYPMVTVNNTSGALSISQYDNDYVDNINDSAEFLLEGSAQANVFIRGSYFYLKQNATLSSTSVATSGSDVELTFTDNQVTDQGSGSSTFLSIERDGNHVIGHNQFRGRRLSLPSPYINTLVGGNEGIANGPTTAWTVDTASSAISIANGDSASLPIGSGLITVTEFTSGNTAVYACGGGSCSLVTPANNWVAPTSTPSSGKLSVAYNGSSGYAIYNNEGATETVGVADLRTRASD